MLISAFASTQIAALFGTAILTVLPATHVLRHDDAGLVAVRVSRALMGRAVPDDLFPADQRRHLHQVAGFADLGRNLAAWRSSSRR